MKTAIDLAMLIPSQDVRKHILDLGWTFSDSNTATLLLNGYSSNRPIEKMFSGLRTLCSQTTDKELQSQIERYLDRVGGAYEKFQKNKEKQYVYVLKVQNQETEDTSYRNIHPSGYFSDFEMACAYGRREKRPFRISMLPVDDPNLLEYYEAGAYCDYEIAYLDFNKNGVPYYFSGQLRESSDDMLHERFENAFVEIPNPFDRGDIVKIVDEEEYGIVETRNKRWQEDLDRYRQQNWKEIEFGDDRIRVVFLDKDGTFGHRHIQPMDMERYKPQITQDDRSDNPRDNLLLTASDLYLGEGSLEQLYFDTVKYREVRKG